MRRRHRAAALLAGGAMLAPLVCGAAHFQTDDIAQGRALFHKTCAQCHGLNMVNSGTTVYDLRRFPVEDPERFFTSVTNGKGNMPSFKESMTLEQVKLVWAYVGSRGGKEP